VLIRRNPAWAKTAIVERPGPEDRGAQHPRKWLEKQARRHPGHGQHRGRPPSYRGYSSKSASSPLNDRAAEKNDKRPSSSSMSCTPSSAPAVRKDSLDASKHLQGPALFAAASSSGIGAHHLGRNNRKYIREGRPLWSAGFQDHPGSTRPHSSKTRQIIKGPARPSTRPHHKVTYTEPAPGKPPWRLSRSVPERPFSMAGQGHRQSSIEAGARRCGWPAFPSRPELRNKETRVGSGNGGRKRESLGSKIQDYEDRPPPCAIPRKASRPSWEENAQGNGARNRSAKEASDRGTRRPSRESSPR